MEFRHDEVTAFFRLIIGGNRAAVEVQEVFMEDDEDGAAPHAADRLRQAIASARLS